MMQLLSIDGLVENIAARLGAVPIVTQQHDHHVLTLGDRNVLVAAADNGDWLCKDLSKPHWHQDNNQLRDHFLETVASMLRGDRPCMACPPDGADRN